MSTPTEETYRQQILDAVAAGLSDRVGGHAAASWGPAEQVAARMLATIPTTHPWDAQIGPFYDTSAVVRLLGVSKQAVADRVQRRTLLAAHTAQGRIVYPTWQFAGQRVIPAVSRILARFRTSPVDGWAIAAWFTTPAVMLDHTSPIDWLTGGGDGTPVQVLADDMAARWNS